MSGSYLQLITTSWLIVLSLHLLLLPVMVLVVTGFHNNNNLLPTTHRHRHLLLCNQKKSAIRIFNTKNDDDTQPIIENNDNDNDDDEKKSSSILSPTSSSSSSSSASASSLGEGFNPLDYRRSNTGVLSSTKSTRISVRSVRMAALTNELLNALGDENAIRIILQDNRDFLLEPLEEDDILVGSRSIYTPDMTRVERYGAYRVSVNERLQSSRNGKAKAVLEAMSEYVLEFEDNCPS